MFDEDSLMHNICPRQKFRRAIIPVQNSVPLARVVPEHLQRLRLCEGKPPLSKSILLLRSCLSPPYCPIRSFVDELDVETIVS